MGEAGQRVIFYSPHTVQDPALFAFLLRSSCFTSVKPELIVWKYGENNLLLFLLSSKICFLKLLQLFVLTINKSAKLAGVYIV